MIKIKPFDEFICKKYAGQCFGADKQIEVLGHGYYNKRKCRIYFVKCYVCSADYELYRDGIFETRIGCLKLGKIPCGCSPNPNWKDWQMAVLITRKISQNTNLAFIGWEDDTYKGQSTKCVIDCKLHGVNKGNTVTHIWNSGYSGCVYCARIGQNSKGEDYTKSLFLSNNTFHPDTTFWKSEREDKNGYKSYWKGFCPECESEFEAQYSSLSAGNRSCNCKQFRQRQLYINIVWDNETPVALKFGISDKYLQRLKVQDRKSIYTVKNYLVAYFEKHGDAIGLERDIKSNFKTGILSKEEMADGWKETISPLLLEELIRFIEQYHVKSKIVIKI